MPNIKSDVSDRLGIPIGIDGQTYKGITIKESNRATVYEWSLNGVQTLQKIARENYNAKGVKAVVFGTPASSGRRESTKFAVYVQDNFLVDIGQE